MKIKTILYYNNLIGPNNIRLPNMKYDIISYVVIYLTNPFFEKFYVILNTYTHFEIANKKLIRI